MRQKTNAMKIAVYHWRMHLTSIKGLFKIYS